MSNIFNKYDCKIEEKLENFEKYITRQSLARFLVRYELFKMTKNVKGSIVECGVRHGGGLMAWSKLSSTLEPYAFNRKVIGFDTFEGFPSVSESDKSIYENESLNKEKGGFSVPYDVFNELNELIEEYDENRFINQIPKVELVKGDANITIPEYVEKNPHLIISLLFLDFDIYEPTKTALEYFLSRVPKGGIVAFDELNNVYWPGETKAALEMFGSLNNIEIKKFDFDPHISYFVV